MRRGRGASVNWRTIGGRLPGITRQLLDVDGSELPHVYANVVHVFALHPRTMGVPAKDDRALYRLHKTRGHAAHISQGGVHVGRHVAHSDMDAAYHDLRDHLHACEADLQHLRAAAIVVAEHQMVLTMQTS